MMNKRKVLELAQSYLGMTPSDKGCEDWLEMQEKFADELIQMDVPYEEEYYIQHGYIGNAICWWSPDHKGYTAHFENAGRYPKPEAMKIVNNRPEQDEAWLCSHVDDCKEAHVLVIDGQHLDTKFRIYGKKK